MARKQGLIIILTFLMALIAAMALIVAPAAQAQEEGTVKGYLFYSPACDDCHQIRAEIIPALYRKWVYRLQIVAVDISDEANYQWLLAFEKAYGVPADQADVPELFIGDQYLIGKQAIEENLARVVQEYADQASTSGTSVQAPDVPRPAGPLEPTVRFMFFYSPVCPHCKYVEETVFPRLKDKYGDRVQWEGHDTSDQANYHALLALEQMAGLPPERRGGVPVVFIGDEFSAYGLFIGDRDIPANLERIVDWAMGIGGIGFPAWKEELFQIVLTPAPTPAPSAEATRLPTPTAPPIHMAYFGEVGCSECDRVSIAIQHVQDEFPSLVVHEFDIMDDLSLNLCLAERLNVPENQRHDAPAVFVGSDYLVDEDIYYESLTEIVLKYVQTGAAPTWEGCTDQEIQLPPPPPWWAVILPGLIDGINPCAFATIVFFVSYLSLLERKGREIWMVGLSFTLAVFLSYLGFGMLLRAILAGLIRLVGPVLRPILNLLTALLCLVLAILSLDDFLKARRGRVKDMALRLPDRLRKWINAVIRRSMSARTFVTASFVAGVIVSFVELACTGQVYVPIIQGLSNPAYRAQSTLGLIVYCLAFITPLVVVFFVSYMGTSSQQLGRLLQQHTGTVKLVTAILFLGIAFWLAYDVLRIWGLISPLKL